MGGVSNLEARPAEQGDHATSVQANNNNDELRPNSEADTRALSAMQKERGTGKEIGIVAIVAAEKAVTAGVPPLPNTTDNRQCRDRKGHGHV